ncbi:MAG TPA: hypothetical protein VI072_24225 [Polyangiaceae bacterium]
MSRYRTARDRMYQGRASVVNRRWFCARYPRLFALVVSAALSACGADLSSPSDEPSARSGQRLDLAELEQHIGPPSIRLAPGYAPADCQKPSRMPHSVERADAELACRKLKIVQHHLNFLMTGRTRRANAEQLAGQGAADRRRQALFGRYFTTHLQNNTLPGQSCDDACVRRAVKGCDDACAAELSAAGVDAELAKSSGFDSDLREAFQRMLAVLIASTAPIDRDDGVEGWWWELPPDYRTDCGVPAGEKCLAERAQLMRDDVNAWITSSGLWVYANTGTPDELPDVSVEGDLDFVLLELIHFMYAFKNRGDLLTDAAVEALVLKRWTEQEIDPMETLKSRAHTVFARWAESNVPFAGQEIRRELVASQHVPLLNIGLSETENHVLMTLAHYYLMNQWISQDYRGNLSAIVQPPVGFTADDWFSHGNGALRAMVRDALARPMHSGFFENNARPYQGYTFHALLAFASYAEDETIRTEAESALHFLSSQFAFQSLEGRRSTPMRRNCEQADQLVMYNRDGTAFGLGVLTGAYKWNDSPYGYRPSLSAPDVCFQGTTLACHWPEFTWKTDASANDSTDPQTPADRRGEKIAQDPHSSTRARNDLRVSAVRHERNSELRRGERSRAHDAWRQ